MLNVVWVDVHVASPLQQCHALRHPCCSTQSSLCTAQERQYLFLPYNLIDSCLGPFDATKYECLLCFSDCFTFLQSFQNVGIPRAIWNFTGTHAAGAFYHQNVKIMLDFNWDPQIGLNY